MKGRRSRRHRHPPDPPNDRRFLDLACISAILEPATSTGPPQENIGCCEVVGGRSCPCHLREALAGFDILSLLTDLARLLQKHGPYEKSKLGFEAINVFTHPFCILIIDSHSLEGLPFANESFDFVHIKRIARGVPEDHAQTSTTPPTTSTTPTMTSMTSVATTVPITIMFVPSKSTVLLHSPWDRIRMRVGPTTSPCCSPPVVEVPALDDNKRNDSRVLCGTALWDLGCASCCSWRNRMTSSLAPVEHAHDPAVLQRASCSDRAWATKGAGFRGGSGGILPSFGLSGDF
ncbi:uncharacterized protein F5891DRAFT_1199433 [Suillus fuscotomentosus]|uniref:Uncharacterized protein n=1 Tax=Suillus fuscotomentosus TaxID=1912939 RepID=A0AAD4HDI9_9AGAM|nr:uncharacterized protein F5891DRAFT_1199433 [Suillus fuscotomentosus]KAG1887994.1 hypothetical protein F5891DRAFT_1199433 [Suillus fuscotomentosus]